MKWVRHPTDTTHDGGRHQAAATGHQLVGYPLFGFRLSLMSRAAVAAWRPTWWPRVSLVRHSTRRTTPGRCNGTPVGRVPIVWVSTLSDVPCSGCCLAANLVAKGRCVGPSLDTRHDARGICFSDDARRGTTPGCNGTQAVGTTQRDIERHLMRHLIGCKSLGAPKLRDQAEQHEGST